MKTATINLELKVNFQDKNDYWFLEELKKEIGKPLYLYAKDYVGLLRLADRNPNRFCFWNDKLYLPDVTKVIVKKIEEE